MGKKHDPQLSKKAKNTPNTERLTPSTDTKVNEVVAETAANVAHNADRVATKTEATTASAAREEVTQAAEAQIPRALQKLIDEGKELTALKNKRDVQYAYKMGMIAVELMDDPGKSYGDGAVATFAEECDVDESTLRHHAAIARAWEAQPFAELVKKGLSLSHLEKLAGVKDEKKREQLIDRVVAERLSSKALGLLIKESKASKDSQDDDVQGDPAGSDVSEDRVTKAINEMDNGIARLIQKMEPLLTSPQRVSPKAVQRLTRMREDHQKFGEKIDALLEQALKQTNTMLPVIAAASTLHTQ
jgi:Asp-tRNA(Asn)/Glu-tRNA(Gln) amidotransferase C subunit